MKPSEILNPSSYDDVKLVASFLMPALESGNIAAARSLFSTFSKNVKYGVLVLNNVPILFCGFQIL